MLCVKCKYDNPADALFCMKCGTKVENRCSSCNTVNPADAKFCGKCGGALGTGAPASSPSAAAAAKTQHIEITERQTAEGLDGERKTVTALFADIKGSTELMEDLDPEEARAIIDPALKLMIEAVRRYDGYVVQSTGDGIFALFGAPVAHEDHPQRALYAALRLQDELKRYSAKVVANGSTPLQGRVGINTGEVVVRSIQTGAGQVEYTPIGHTTNLASRMQAVAPVGSIAVAEPTRKLCEGYFTLKPLGPTRVKGVSEPVNVYEVTGLGSLRTRLQRSAGRGLTKFVGRAREMETLKHAAEQAKSGHGQIVAAMAEPGVGKSRMFFEFKGTSQTGWMVLDTFSVSHGKASAYLPVIDLLRNYFDISAPDDERKRREKVTGRVLALDRSMEDTLPYLFGLLGIVEGDDPLAQMDGQIRKSRTLDAIKRIVLRESLNQPLMIIFEDLHWIDEQTQELLNLLADSIGTARILLLVNYRPEYSHGWGSKTYYTQMRLDPLGQESATEMLSALLGDGKDLLPLKRLIVERTEGTPFFMEEILQALFEDGVLQRDGTVKLVKSMSAVNVPATVQAVLAARIDRLSAEEKELLQTLAVVGREFALSLVRRVLDGRKDDELERMLADLQIAEFIYEQPATGDVEYIFKHALTQEVAYNALLVERRKLLHERAAQATESLFAGNLADHYEDLAHHYIRSGNALKAAKYLHLAGKQAMNRSAHAEAKQQLTAALDLLRAQPDDFERERIVIGVLLSLANCIAFTVGGLAESADILEQAYGLCEKIGDEAARLEVLLALSDRYTMRFEHRKKGRSLLEELLRAGQRTHDTDMVGWARSWLGWSSLFEGDFISASEEFDQAHDLSSGIWQKRAAASLNWQVLCRAAACFALWVSGYPVRATDRCRVAFVVAREISASPADLLVTWWWSAVLNLMLGDRNSAYSHFDKAVKLAEEHGMTGLLGVTALFRGWALARLGHVEEGLSEMLQYRDEEANPAITAFASWVFVGLAEAYLAAGRPREGLEAVSTGLEVAQHTETRAFHAEMLRLKGELLSMSDHRAPAEAEHMFREAIDVARRQSAKSWELRATMSLARLLAKQGRRDEARAMLAEIYGWFTEGFDTADLKEAKSLLNGLNE